MASGTPFILIVYSAHDPTGAASSTSRSSAPPAGSSVAAPPNAHRVAAREATTRTLDRLVMGSPCYILRHGSRGGDGARPRDLGGGRCLRHPDVAGAARPRLSADPGAP